MDRDFHNKLSHITDELYSHLRRGLYYPVLVNTSTHKNVKNYSNVQLSILRYLSIHGESSIQEVAFYKQLSLSNFSKIIKPLLLGNLIDRKQGKDNRAFISNTKEGEKFINDLEEQMALETMRIFNESMSDEKQKELFTLIDKLNVFLRENSLSVSDESDIEE